MDELLIEEKKYVSSKRAAKMTGYAKDYVGQLCREGRVPARLVGRSWYVLESAIQDHRFGTPEQEPKKTTWESPRYEASSNELVSPINQLTDADDSVVDAQEDNPEESQHVQNSWREWFDRFNYPAEDIPAVENERATEEPVAQILPEEPEKSEDTTMVEIDAGVEVPIHTVYQSVYQSPPEELLPNHHREVESSNKDVIERKSHKKANKTIQIAGVAVAVCAAALAIIGSGRLDTYIISNSQARIMAGVILYKK